MPVVSIKMAKGRSLQQKRELAEKVTAVLVETLALEPEWVTVLIEEMDRENWATGGQLHLDKFGEGFGKKVDQDGKRKGSMVSLTEL